MQLCVVKKRKIVVKKSFVPNKRDPSSPKRRGDHGKEISKLSEAPVDEVPIPGKFDKSPQPGKKLVKK